MEVATHLINHPFTLASLGVSDRPSGCLRYTRKPAKGEGLGYIEVAPVVSQWRDVPWREVKYTGVPGRLYRLVSTSVKMPGPPGPPYCCQSSGLVLPEAIVTLGTWLYFLPSSPSPQVLLGRLVLLRACFARV